MTIYMMPYQGESRVSKNIPLRVVERYDYHVSLESMSYPSLLGMSRPFRISFSQDEIKRAPSMSEHQFIQWVERRKEFVDTVFTAHQGNPRARETLREWDEVKAELRR